MLILFDVNGVLCFKVREKTELAGLDDQDIIKAASYWMVLRPGIVEILRRLSKEHTLGIFSSTTFKNVNPILSVLEKHGVKFSIKAYREYTQLDPDFEKNDNIKEFDTVKRLNMIWQHPYFNTQRQWNERNTLLIDDSTLKTRFNNDANVLIVESFDRESYISNNEFLNESFRLGIEMALTNLQLKYVHVGSISSLEEKSDSLDLEPRYSNQPATSGSHC